MTVVRASVRAVGGEVGLAQEATEVVAAAATELVRNQLVHARDGRFGVRAIERRGVPGLELIAADRGPGLAEPGRAFDAMISTSGGLGSGLASVRRFMDELDVDVRLGEGTCIWARKFAGQVAYRSEVAILGRPCEGERESGDDAAFLRQADALTIGVIDGLGHGILAREVAAPACSVLRSHLGQASLRQRHEAALESSLGIDCAPRSIPSLPRATTRTVSSRTRKSSQIDTWRM